MDHLPIFCQLRHRACLLVGGGDVAERKARLLLEAGAALTVNALAFAPQFEAWAEQGMLRLVQGEFNASLLDDCWLAIAATDDDAVNNQVSEAAEARRIFCNVVDAPKQASFIMPSIIDRSPLMVAVSSGGTSPVLARLLREKLEALLPQHLGKVAGYAGQLRRRVKQTFASMSERRRFWEKFFVNDRLAQSLANDDEQAVNRITETLLSEPLDDRGEVVLVGAGPGDPGLLTLKGLQQIQQADIVVYDRLVSDEIMNLVRRDADRVFVGKRAGYHCVPQEEINQILLREAQRGKRVVRLKGGDPFIFGRGGEELETLCDAGIPFSVVPGITAASGCSAYAGLPLTHRDYAQSVRLITGHLKNGGEFDWHNLAAEKQTLVFYMGLNQAAAIQEKLIEHGMDPQMPVALVENGTSVKQRVVAGVLSELGALAQRVESPSLIIVGRVVALRDKLNWFSSK
ncbi:siroheme synthase CysG [Cronobacter malonaticus]|uniref:Siroheme synthase n=1 Tax=Cronobacter malonaticus TaxID=413503 RepID=A0ABX5JXM4_9ENTR|nr:siroheme synthase CysG [Cronobacter malonaticus]CCJ92619.1 Siroheme synthase / Precorrin-2 oxidase / Sirohydrochlorin ferrochelatase / Uroporphyrinogen-III methyltransferase [Cronobacter malonaticus 681]ALX76958.1 siroheme synthase [Cronobacter malonaticus LMG 23826]EGT4281972.1 uroporphyrinogen-III C-methyltransferase [Cronobacter malonaticus]EGT4289444.1 uroporphyrinogen-III C-methyltransferase [Cronobacter malonaticus]EGT4296305.1 uroporphyrinogen-III C-methyltransferase [Cronobacter mal